MDDEQDWNDVLRDHPIFGLPKGINGPGGNSETSLQLSTNTLQQFKNVDSRDDSAVPSGRRQTMVLKGADLIVAAGQEIRMTTLGETHLNQNEGKKVFKTLHCPNVQFNIHQIALNPSGKLLAVAGAFQVAVIVLPRPGFMRLVPNVIDCKSVQIGQYYHGSKSAAPIAKVDWHPWGEAGSTLMVMTVDGKMREYDVSVDPEEPLQVLSFVPEKKRRMSYLAEDPAEREVTSFTIGKGNADWGPLTIYALMKSGDVYAICPYMPQNASIPSSYVHSLECFISAKQEFLSQGTSEATQKMTTLYDYQRKYVSSLVKQLPPGTAFPSVSRRVPIHPPTTLKSKPKRQGPFLLQPSPRNLDGSDGGDATDIIYLAFGGDFLADDDDDDGSATERLGAILVAYQDGRIDTCLDVEKVEARWETKPNSEEYPMLAVYETIDLDFVGALNSLAGNTLDLLQGNFPVFMADPIHEATVYVYHAFGAHRIDLAPLFGALAAALRADDEGDAQLSSAVRRSSGADVQPLLTTFSVERKCSNPVIGVAIPNDIYLTYSIFILTSAMRITTFRLGISTPSPQPTPRATPAALPPPETPSTSSALQVQPPDPWLQPPSENPPYVSLLEASPYHPPPILRSSGLPSQPRLSLPEGADKQKDFLLTPDTLRYLASKASAISGQIRDATLAYKAALARTLLQKQELARQCAKAREMQQLVGRMRGGEREARWARAREEQKALLGRMDRVLGALVRKASPELSEHETRWFEELKRMRDEIAGVGKYDEGSLAVRARTLESEYARLMPSFKALAEQERKRRQIASESSQTLGQAQAFALGERNQVERTRINKLVKDVTRLASQLDLNVGKPPSIS
ncbi:hypothetical protein K523DRAFT_352178 [Schizophyllum commune Tattone D]|nr:hypothetical protein K523DRAFT_352178 [Schizophyllum commune Tattone D]